MPEPNVGQEPAQERRCSKRSLFHFRPHLPEVDVAVGVEPDPG